MTLHLVVGEIFPYHYLLARTKLMCACAVVFPLLNFTLYSEQCSVQLIESGNVPGSLPSVV